MYHREGFDEFTDLVVKRLSGEGYLVAVPDVSHRIARDIPMRDRKQYFKDSEIVTDIAATVAWLRSRADASAAAALWATRVPGGTPTELASLLDVVAAPSAVAARIRHGVGLAWRMRGWRRIGPIPALASRLHRIGILAACRLRRRRPLTLRSGGSVVALVGPKASGKSTLAEFLRQRIGKHLDVRRIHVGKPPPTALTFPLRLALPALRRLLPSEQSGEYQRPERRAEMRYSLAHVVRMLAVAYERRSLLLRTHRAAAAGAVFVADRYPSSDVWTSDSSQFGDEAIAACSPGLKRALMRLERACYSNLPQPDLVVRLSASIETTVLRDATRAKSDAPDAEMVRRRRDIETSATFPGVASILVNTDCDLESAEREILRGVWRHL
jgi:hypothetical protein